MIRGTDALCHRSGQTRDVVAQKEDLKHLD